MIYNQINHIHISIPLKKPKQTITILTNKTRFSVHTECASLAISKSCQEIPRRLNLQVCHRDHLMIKRTTRSNISVPITNSISVFVRNMFCKIVFTQGFINENHSIKRKNYNKINNKSKNSFVR